MKFTGGRDAYRSLVAGLGIPGEWAEEGDKLVYRCASGPVINWWPDSKKKTVMVQGGGDANSFVATAVEAALNGGQSFAAEPGGPAYSAQVPQSKVFVVHGHDQAARDQLELFLHRLGLDPFVLQDSGGGGMTIIEALEHSIVEAAPAFGIVLMTPDDVGYAKSGGPTCRCGLLVKRMRLKPWWPFDSWATRSIVALIWSATL